MVYESYLWRKEEGRRKEEKKGREEITEVTESMNRDHLPSREATASYRIQAWLLADQLNFQKAPSFNVISPHFQILQLIRIFTTPLYVFPFHAATYNH